MTINKIVIASEAWQSPPQVGHFTKENVRLPRRYAPRNGTSPLLVIARPKGRGDLTILISKLKSFN